MTPERWARIKALFHPALERDTRGRAAFLDAACAGDPSLRAELDQLVASDEQAGSFLEAAAFEAQITLGEEPADALVGSRVGAYEILRAVGRGGMGAVYLAARADSAYRKQVAIKVIRRGIGTDAIIRSFRAERQILANLEHPNIARLLDGGTTADGLPYFVMEYVEGLPLDVYCDRSTLTIDERLDLFRTVCAAVHYAHQRGVIHRDLKPTNILVTADRVPKLLDFGIAKVLRPDVLTTVIDRTAIMRPMTPAYASPEQVRGDAITPATDVYALGVMLYELVTGHRPYRFRIQTPQEIERVICEQEPEKPSTAVRATEEIPTGDGAAIGATPQTVSTARREQVDTLRRRLSGDLDTIVLVALRKEPHRRYASADALAEDLRRHQTGLPITARRSTFVYRAGKFVRRNRASVVTAGVSLVVIVGLAMIVVWRGGGAHTSRGGAAGVEATFTQLTTEPGMELNPSLSPDGRWIVYTSTTSGNEDIYLRAVGGQTAINLTKDSPASETRPVFSPNGESIAFRSNRDGGGIFVMGRTGESVRRLTESGFNPAWSPTGEEIVFAEETVGIYPAARKRSSALWAVTVATGTKRLVTKGDAVQPSWSPHGHRIAFWAIAFEKNGQADLWTVGARGGPALRVTDDASLDWNPIWSPDGRYLYYASDRSGTMNLWRVPIDEPSGRVLGSAEAITTPSPYVGHLTIAADGRHVAYTSFIRTANLYTVALDPAAKTVIGNAAPITVGTKQYIMPNLSPDGGWVTFSDTEAQEDIFVSRTDGRGLRQLTDDGASDRRPRWSPDGTRIAFSSNRTGRFDIWAIRPDGSGLEPLTETAHGLQNPVWSPDGSRMAATASDGAVYLFDPRVPWNRQQPQVLPAHPSGGIFEAWSWSWDGTRLAGAPRSPLPSSTTRGILSYDITSRAYETLADFGFAPVWLNDNDTLVFSSENKLFLVDHTKRVRELLSAAPDRIPTFDVSRDNRRLVFTRVVAEADIWLATLK